MTTNATTSTKNNRLPVLSNCETANKENESTRSQPKRGAKSRAQPEGGNLLLRNV